MTFQKQSCSLLMRPWSCGAVLVALALGACGGEDGNTGGSGQAAGAPTNTGSGQPGGAAAPGAGTPAPGETGAAMQPMTSAAPPAMSPAAPTQPTPGAEAQTPGAGTPQPPGVTPAESAPAQPTQPVPTATGAEGDPPVMMPGMPEGEQMPSEGMDMGEPGPEEDGTETPMPVGDLELSGLMVEPNPNSTISAYVSWTTPTPASSAVQFGIGEYTWEISDDAMVTEHRVLVIGMRPSETYQIKAVSFGEAGSGEATSEFQTGALPDIVPMAEVSDYDPALAQPGWTLINVQKGQGDYRARSDHPPMAVIYDEEGYPVWYQISGNSPDVGGAVSTDITDVGVLVGPQMLGGASPVEYDFAGNVTWQCSDVRCGGSDDLSHHANKLPNGNFVVNRDVNQGGVTMPVFEEFQPPNNDVVWELDLRTVLAPPQSASGDWCHGNAITVFPEKNEAYVSCRFLGVIKTTYENPQLIWHLPATYGAQGMGDFTFDPPESQFSDIHEPEIHEDGTIMVFDNGGWAGTVTSYNPTGLKSRVLEFELDEENGVARRVWEFPGSFSVDSWYNDSWYQPFWGDADRLPNRNVLMTSGVRGPDLRSRVFEATDDGQVVWVMQLPPDHGLYRADRIDPPLVRRL